MFFGKTEQVFNTHRVKLPGNTEHTVSDEMQNALDVWNDIYRNNAPWLWNNTDLKSLNLGVSIAAEFARLVTLEMKTKVEGEDERSRYIDAVYQSFLPVIRKAAERACALGGVCFKPYVSGGRMKIDIADTGDFIPLCNDDDGNITAAAFISRHIAGKKRYTKIETHYFADGKEQVITRGYLSRGGSASLGTPVELSEVKEWADIPAEFTVEGIEQPLFCYFKMPYANEIDRESPLGVSVYSRAVELLRDADEQYTRFLWEFEGGELAIDADSTALKTVRNGKSVMPEHNKRVFKKLMRGLDVGDETFYKPYAPTLRDESLSRGLNAILRRIEFSCSLAYGTLSEIADVEKTAEEIRNSKQRSYAAVRDIQKSLEDTLKRLAYIIGVWGGLYGFCAPTGEISTSFEWDDSIVSDRAQEFTEKTQLVRDGIMQPWELRAWYFGEDEKTARKRVAEDAEIDVE